LKILFRLMYFTRGRRDLLLLGVILAAGLTLASAGIPYLVGKAVDSALRNEGGLGALVPFVLGILGLAALRYLLSFGRRYATNYMGHLVEYRMRRSLFDRLLGLHHGFYNRSPTGELVSRAVNDLRVIRFFIGWGAFQIIISLLTLVVVSVALFYINATLAAIVLAPMPVLAAVAWRFSSSVHPIFRSVQQKLADVTTQVQENVSGIRVVKSFAREPFEMDQFGDRAEGVLERNLAARRIRAFYIPAMSFLPATSIALLLLFGGQAVVSGELTVGEFTAFNLFIGQLVWPMRGFGMVLDQAQRAIASCERVFEILDERPEIASPTHPFPFPEEAGVEFRGVSFSYGSEPVLDGVSLSAEPGETVALVGATGAGKSSLLSLIPRFYDVEEGSVRVGGADVRDLDLAELRRSVGFVFQDTFLFSETVAENIAFGEPEATREEIQRAAEVAGLHDQISGFPQGYDTQVGEWGITLSGGQKQRMAIARALVKDPRILILDDATSSVDAETERHIQRALGETLRSSASRTTFIVAHRLSTILLADRIVVLEDGRIVESGSHEELIRRGGLYAEMYGERETA
jgi:ATP-binding cassette subfamily B protein